MEVDRVAKILITNSKKTGTAFLVRDNIVITAFHCIKEHKKADITFSWVIDSGQKPSDTPETFKSKIKTVLWRSEKCDVIVLEVERSPSGLSGFCDICFASPESGTRWESFGYPKSSINTQDGLTGRTPEMGTFFSHDKTDFRHKLKTENPREEKEYLGGISGAPVIVAGTNKLAAIITRTGPLREGEVKAQVEKHCIYSTSIPYLIQKNDKFKQAILGSDLSEYTVWLETQIGQQLKKLEDSPLKKWFLEQAVKDNQYCRAMQNAQDCFQQLESLYSNLKKLSFDERISIYEEVRLLISLSTSLIYHSGAIPSSMMNDLASSLALTEVKVAKEFLMMPKLVHEDNVAPNQALRGQGCISDMDSVKESGPDLTSITEEYTDNYHRAVDCLHYKIRKQEKENKEDKSNKADKLQHKIYTLTEADCHNINTLKAINRRVLKAQDKKRSVFYFASDKNHKHSYLNNPEVIRQLKMSLPDVPIKQYGYEATDAEIDLEDYIREILELFT